jgi:hypothetical protein
MRFSLLVLSAALLLSACSRTVSDAPDQVLEYTVPTGDLKYADSIFGKEAWFAIGAFAPTQDAIANGVAQAHFFESGDYRLTVQLNVERAKDGAFYEVWLAKEGEEPRSVGHLRSVLGDVRHALEYTAKEDLRDSLTVLVTLELDDGNSVPGLAIASAQLAHYVRD